MHEQRRTEVKVLGYRIERVQTLDDRGQPATRWYEVLAPETDRLLGSFAHRAEHRSEPAIPRPLRSAWRFARANPFLHGRWMRYRRYRRRCRQRTDKRAVSNAQSST